MQDIIDKLQAELISEMKQRSGFKSTWEIMGVSQRKEFLESIGGRFKRVINAPAVRQKPAGKEEENTAGPNKTTRNATSSQTEKKTKTKES